MIKKILAMAFLLAGVISAGAMSFSDETLHYVVTYKWGLIHKDAGEAIVTLRNQGGNYKIRLTAKTKPWADRYFPLRDTLMSTVQKDGFKPLSYVKVAHEDGAYSRDEVRFSYSGNVVLGAAKRHKIRKSGSESNTETTLSASGRAYDFLSAFYYLRTLDFSSMTPNSKIRTTVFSGTKSETLTIKLVGTERITLRNGQKREAYKLVFRFTTSGGSRSSDDIEAWVSTDASHTVLQLVGQLPVGQIKVHLV